MHLKMKHVDLLNSPDLFLLSVVYSAGVRVCFIHDPLM